MRPIDKLKMEFLQVAYVHAVVANAGKSCDNPRRDIGTDLRVVDWLPREQNPNRYYDGGIIFNCQLKASTRCTFNNSDELVFPMKVQEYNDLATWKGVGIMILIAFNMPDDLDLWFSQNCDILSLRHCCYWAELTGREPSQSKPNSSKNVKIPRKSIFDSSTVSELAKRARQDVYS